MLRKWASKFGENNRLKFPLETQWKNCIFDLCGVNDFTGECSVKN
jgi:hypothetical protein